MSENNNSSAEVLSFPETASVDSVLIFSQMSTERTYVLGSLTPISPDLVIVTNISPIAILHVSIQSSNGIIFTPSKFTLVPFQPQLIEITFVPAAINTLSAGKNVANCLFQVSSPNVKLVPPVTGSTNTGGGNTGGGSGGGGGGGRTGGGGGGNRLQ